MAPSDELHKLVELRDAGLLSPEEFEAAKRKVLDGHAFPPSNPVVSAEPGALDIGGDPDRQATPEVVPTDDGNAAGVAEKMEFDWDALEANANSAVWWTVIPIFAVCCVGAMVADAVLAVIGEPFGLSPLGVLCVVWIVCMPFVMLGRALTFAFDKSK